MEWWQRYRKPYTPRHAHTGTPPIDQTGVEINHAARTGSYIGSVNQGKRWPILNVSRPDAPSPSRVASPKEISR